MFYLRRLFTYNGVQYIVCCVAVLVPVSCIVYPMFPVSLDCSFLIATSIFFNVYSNRILMI